MKIKETEAVATPVNTVEMTPIAVATAEPLAVATTASRTVNVLAPANLRDGATFEAIVDGITFTVTVPRGGVCKGEIFAAPYPTSNYSRSQGNLGYGISDDHLRSRNNSNINNDTITPPTGKWRTDLCDCCKSRNCCGLCCVATFCSCLLNAQLRERLGFKMGGCQPHHDRSLPRSVCQKVIWLNISFGVIWFLVYITLLFHLDEFFVAAPFLILALIAFGVSMFVCLTLTRKSMRDKYDLPETCCVGADCCCMDDCCLTLWCSCCSSIQMSSHTHDQSIHPYECCSPTGLRKSAPKIV